MKTLLAADLFCGAGGSSTGLARVAEKLGRKLRLTAVNHWERAVETHSQNHPAADHHCEDLTALDPRKAVPGGRLDILVASPECTHHSVARGGKPVNDQSRASAWCVQRWATALRIDRILIENVPEFATWGPIGSDGRPLKSKKGETFAAWVKALEALGYRVEWRVLNAADFGGATSRRRLFVQAVRGRRPIAWPEPTHEPNPSPGLFGSKPRWRAAREIIDWTILGESVFSRKKALSPNTMKRIEAGLRKFGGAAAEPFLVLLRGKDPSQVRGSARTLSEPTPTFGTSGAHLGVCEPFVMRACNGGDDNCRNKSLDVPIGTIHAGGGSFALVEPFLVPTNYGERPGQSPRCHDIALPCPTVVASGQTHGVVQPFIVPHRQFDGMQVDDVDRPIRTITATNGRLNGVCQPFLTPFYANGEADSADEPLRTVTCKDRHALVQPDGVRRDILFRMLQPAELAAAMGFPPGYRITGNRAEQVKQIGNAVEVNTAAAICGAMIGGEQ